MAVNVAGLALGAVAIAAVVTARALLTGWRIVGRTRDHPSRAAVGSVLAERAARAGAAP